MERTEEQQKNIRIMQLYDSHIEGWQDILDVIDDRLQIAMRGCFDAKGEVADYQRGEGHALEELLNAFETMVQNGRELLKQEQARPD